MGFSSADVRRFLLDAFSDAELEAWSFDRFPEAHKEFTAGMSKSEKVQLLIEYCQDHDLVAPLFAALQAERPEQYQRAFGKTPPTGQLRQLFVASGPAAISSASIPMLSTLTERRIADLNQTVRYYQAYMSGLLLLGSGMILSAFLPIAPSGSVTPMLTFGGMFICSLSVLLIREIITRQEKLSTCQSLKLYLTSLQQGALIDTATTQRVNDMLWQTFQTAIR